MWCNGPKIERLLEELKTDGIDLLRYREKGRDVWLGIRDSHASVVCCWVT
jgi:hypothetical protein